MSVCMFSNTEFSSLGNYLSLAYEAHGVPNIVPAPSTIARALFDMNVASYNARYPDYPYADNFEYFENAPVVTDMEAFFLVRNIVVESICAGDETIDDINQAMAKYVGYEYAQNIIRFCLSGSFEVATHSDSLIGRCYKFSRGSQFGYVLSLSQGTPTIELFTKRKFSGTNAEVAIVNIFDELLIRSTTDIENIVCDSTYSFMPALTPQQAATLKQRLLDIEEAKRDAAKAKALENMKHAEATRSQLESIMPKETKALIVARLEVDESDSMSDYHGSSTQRSVIIGFSKHTRDLFPEMRKAAKHFSDTAHMATLPKEAEHREKYSMGGGYYLKDGYRHSSGWTINKVSLNFGLSNYDRAEIAPHLLSDTQRTEQSETKLTTVTPSAQGDTVTMRINSEKEGVELHFSDKPDSTTISQLHAYKFRYHRRNKFWYAKQTDGRLKFAKQLCSLSDSSDAISEKTHTAVSSDDTNPAVPFDLHTLLFGDGVC